MWNPINITFTNLFAHKSSNYDFVNNKCTVIFGENKTDVGFENNGAGKSTLLEAICIAYSGSSLRNINKEDFINNTEEYCEVDFTLQNNVFNKKLRIYRKFFRGKKSAIIKIYENDIHQKELVSVNEANKRIHELIGISSSDFLNYFVISQDSRYSFFTAGDVEKKDIMNRITSADMINPALAELSKRLKECQKEFDIAESSLSKCLGKIELIQQQIDEATQDSEKENELAELRKKKINVIEKISELDSQLSEIDDSLDGYKTKLDKKLAVLNKYKAKNISVSYNALNSDLKAKKKTLKEVEHSLEDTVSCPNCSTEFSLDKTFDLSLKQLKKMEKDLTSEIESIQSDMDLLSEQLDKMETVEEEISAIQKSIRKCNSDKESVEYDIKSLKSKLKTIKSSIIELKNSDEDKEVVKLQEKLQLYESEKEICEQSLVSVTSKLDMIKYWQYYLGKSGFTTFLANKSVKVIEGVTNSFLKRFKTDIRVLISGFKVLKDGSVREKIEVFINSDGLQSKSFLANSGGERGRVQLAGILGIQHLINMSTDGNGLNLLCLDEVLHGVDPKGNENMIKILEKMNITTLLITQNINESLNVENKLKVIKIGGVSKYV